MLPIECLLCEEREMTSSIQHSIVRARCVGCIYFSNCVCMLYGVCKHIHPTHKLFFAHGNDRHADKTSACCCCVPFNAYILCASLGVTNSYIKSPHSYNVRISFRSNLRKPVWLRIDDEKMKGSHRTYNMKKKIEKKTLFQFAPFCVNVI